MDKSTSDWAKEEVGDLNPWEGVKLKAVDGEAVPHQTTLRAFFPDIGKDSQEHILRLVGDQNEGLKTGGWCGE